MARAGLALLAALVISPALAYAPDTSLRPQPRDIDHPGIVLIETVPLLRPRARGDGQVTQSAPEPAKPVASALTPARSLRPIKRPSRVVQTARVRDRNARRGMICGSREIQGEVVGFVPGRITGCGISEAVRVKSVSGIGLSQQALMDCTTAKALNRWVNNGVKPALRSKGRVVELRVAAHYACRTRNNQRGARISEHGKGRAIDISGFRMDDGQTITVLEHWNARGFRSAMRKMHKTACGPFGTVLGPESDRFHRDHFHFDTARYRSGPYCR